MKKMLKVFVFMLTLILFTSSVTFAANVDEKLKVIKINEYDLYNQMVSKTDKELKNLGLDDEQIKELRNFDFNKILSDRAKLSNNELKKMGYTDKEISNLKKLYEQTESNRQVKNKIEVQEIRAAGLFADVTMSTWLVSASDKSIKVGFNWSWSKLPLYVGGKDVIAVLWKGTNNNGQPLNVRINSSSSYIKLRQENTKYPELGGQVDEFKFDVVDYYNSAKCEFKLSCYAIEDMIVWYKSGSGVIQIDASGTDSIKEVAMKISYGHTYIFLSPGVSFAPLTFSINFDYNCTEMATDNAIYSKSGKRKP